MGVSVGEPVPELAWTVIIGYRAIDTLRMEKGLYCSTDITPDVTAWSGLSANRIGR